MIKETFRHGDVLIKETFRHGDVMIKETFSWEDVLSRRRFVGRRFVWRRFVGRRFVWEPEPSMMEAEAGQSGLAVQTAYIVRKRLARLV